VQEEVIKESRIISIWYEGERRSMFDQEGNKRITAISGPLLLNFFFLKEALFVFSSGVELKYQNTLELHEIR
jgi:hypothetical protein